MIIYMKSKEEIAAFKEVGGIASKILKELMSSAKPGVSTKVLDELAIRLCKENEVNPIFLGHQGFPAAICTSKNKVLVHGVPDDVPLKEEDLLSIDIGVERDGYIGDTAKTVCVGVDELDIAIQCNKALMAAIDKAVAGNKLNDVAKVIVSAAKSCGYTIPMNYGGHGIDRYKLHSDPFVSNYPLHYHDLTLRVGMVFAIEPMFIYSKNNSTKVSDENGWSVIANGPSAHCEHTIAITESGAIVLTEEGSQ